MLCVWRADIDSLQFKPQGHDGWCVVHRRAFRTLLAVEPSSEDCQAWFAVHSAAFQRAAAVKVTRAALPTDANFHLTSRDVSRALRAPLPNGQILVNHYMLWLSAVFTTRGRPKRESGAVVRPIPELPRSGNRERPASQVLSSPWAWEA